MEKPIVRLRAIDTALKVYRTQEIEHRAEIRIGHELREPLDSVAIGGAKLRQCDDVATRRRDVLRLLYESAFERNRRVEVNDEMQAAFRPRSIRRCAAGSRRETRFRRSPFERQHPPPN